MDCYDKLAKEMHDAIMGAETWCDDVHAAALLRERIAPLVEALDGVEWVVFNELEHPRCPWCKRRDEANHAPDCPRQLALAQWNTSSVLTDAETGLDCNR